MVGKKQLIGDINNIVFYIASHNSTNILRKRSSSSSVVKGVRLIGEKTKSNARRYLKMMGRSINPALHAWVIVECVVIEVAELRDVSLQGEAW